MKHFVVIDTDDRERGERNFIANKMPEQDNATQEEPYKVEHISFGDKKGQLQEKDTRKKIVSESIVCPASLRRKS